MSSSEEHQWPGYYSQIQEITVFGSEMNPFLELVVFLSCVLVPCPSQAVEDRELPADGSYSSPTSEKPGLCGRSICDVLQVTHGAPAMPHSCRCSGDLSAFSGEQVVVTSSPSLVSFHHIFPGSEHFGSLPCPTVPVGSWADVILWV